MMQQFPPDARLDYKIIVDGAYLLDPLNPRTQLGGYGPNSVLYMPEYRYPEETLPRPGVAQGQLSEPLTIRSRALGYDVQYQVYTPAGYETLQDLPVIYATDGQEYAHPDMGALPIVLDNLIADGAIRPVLAVFIDMRDPATGGNRRETLLVANDRFQQFLVAELVPAIDQAYRTRAAADGRAILGTSLGGLARGLHRAASPGRVRDGCDLLALLSRLAGSAGRIHPRRAPAPQGVHDAGDLRLRCGEHPPVKRFAG